MPLHFLTASLALLLLTNAQRIRANDFLERRFVNAQGESMRYLLFVPKEYDKQKKYPLVLWLHGGGARGDSLKLILSWGDKHGPLFFARSENQSAYPCFILAPQCSVGRFWADPDSEKPRDEIRLVLEVLDSIQKEFHIDDARLYVMGISMGGYGTWDIIARRPNTFAAAIPICGGGNPAKAALMKNTSIWAFHGDEDNMVDVKESRRMIEAIKRTGGKPRYTEYQGVGHNAWERAFAEPDFLSWIFSQSRVVPDSMRPSGRAGHCLVYDEKLQMVLLLNGYQPPYQPAQSEIWGWNGEHWNLLVKNGAPSRVLGGAAYDSRRKRLVEFGGIGMKGYSELKGDTWEWDGRAWHLMPDTSAGTRDHHAMVYDESRGVTVMYGGQNFARQFDTNTWEWNGSAWKKIVAPGPGNRAHHAMAYDAKRKRVVLFGGFGDGVDEYFDDTWEWDGTSWKQVATSGPPPRARHRMAFDAKLGKIILFGGTGVKTTPGPGFNFLGDTWLWDGRAWSEAKATGPTARSMHAMAYDAHRQKIVVFGGGSGGRKRLNDMWEWDGKAWRKAQ